MRSAAEDHARRWDRLALAAVVVGALVRVWWCFFAHPALDHVFSDMFGYVDRAVRLADGSSLGRYAAFYPPGAHMLLSVPALVLDPGRDGLWGGVAIWWALSASIPLLAWRLARRLLNPVAGALTAVLCALYPLHVLYAGYFLSEVPATAFLLGALCLGYRARDEAGHQVAFAVAAGVLAGAALAVRPQLLLNVAILAAAFLRRPGRRWAPVAAMAAAALVPVAGAIAHNTAQADRLTGLSENSGLNFFIGRCDIALVNTLSRDGLTRWQFGTPPAIQQGGRRTVTLPDREIWDEGWFFEEGARCVRDDGLGHARIVGRSVLDLTATSVPWPMAADPDLEETARVTNIVYVGLLPAIVIAAAGLARWRRFHGERSGEVTLLLHLACILPTAIAFFGEPRFRILPYDVFGLALMAAAIASLAFGAPRVQRLPRWRERRPA